MATIRRLIIDGVPPQASLSDVYHVFGKYGCISDLVPYKSKYLITYATCKQAERVFNVLNNKHYPNSNKTLTIKFAEYKPPNCLSVFNFSSEDQSKLEEYFKEISGFDHIYFLSTRHGFCSFGYVTFNRSINMKLAINKAPRFSSSKKKIYYEETPFIEPNQENLLEMAHKFESRCLVINDLLTNPGEKLIESAFSQFGIVNFVEIRNRFNFFIVKVLMDTHENARRAMRELNYMYFGEENLPLHIYPYFNVNLSHDRKLGLITLNEIDCTFNCSEIYNRYDQFGELYAACVCPCANAFILVLLYNDYSSAKSVLNDSDEKNVFLFPAVPLVHGIRFFHSERKDLHPMLVTFGHLKLPDNLLRKSFSSDNFQVMIDNFYTINYKNVSKICVTKYKNIWSLRKSIEDFVKKQNTNYEIVDGSPLSKLFEYVMTMPIPLEWKGKLFYLKNVGEKINNLNLRLKLEKICHVEAVINFYPNYTLALFDDMVDPENPEFLNLFTNPIKLEEAMNQTITPMTPRSMSQGEIWAKFQPRQQILDYVKENEPVLLDKAKKRLESLSRKEIDALIPYCESTLDEFLNSIRS
ncbi:hypothetical protein TVAG_056850 [Trichomonas vaginalis G3]|uniref:RRM domain-containing protein n=1 Tax=Trichomonas vaginalis (strain ATCC PRA-98 / G3) TaxID=412133 RepID=A2EK93_TRIV3|nr:RNA-binding domain, RBD family-containing protein [Trichomonas vaginalis G3]EAY06891.1 hypothetical protein TVAG_056850 [Trichomonas vaginalis G3]KAI5513948.1 RNA-binding domain, RBD family-containing protein [Trichomonas vaginalis G3]|eukprot:XP_001319114.1 hypothetical protein [Trichomonas vaginalis G3]